MLHNDSRTLVFAHRCVAMTNRPSPKNPSDSDERDAFPVEPRREDPQDAFPVDPREEDPPSEPPERPPFEPPERPPFPPVVKLPDRWKDCDFVQQDKCCRPPCVMLVGKVRARTERVGSEIDLRQMLQLRSNAGAATAPSRQPAANADGLARIAAEQVFTKPKDCVLLISEYEIEYSADGGCPPYTIEIVTGGDIDSTHECLPEAGRLQLSAGALFRGEDYATRAPGGLVVRAFVIDCQGQADQCQLILPGP